MLEKDKSEILKDNYVLIKRKNARKNEKFKKDRNVTFVVAFIISLFAIAFIYFNSSYAKTFKVVVSGNIYLNEEDVINIAQPSENYILTFPKSVEKRLKKNPLIEDAEVIMKNGNIVSINIKEHKAVGYRINGALLELILIDDTKVSLTSDNMYLIEKVPLIEGYSDEEITKIIHGFEDVDYKTINEISEIHKYPVSYDKVYMEVIMRDGNYCFLSYTALDLLDSYYGVSSSIDKSKGYACIYFDDLTNGAYASVCPWQVSNIEKEITPEDKTIVE